MTLSADLPLIVEEACARAGLDPSMATPIRMGENFIYRVGDAVVRIGRVGQGTVAAREVAVSGWLAQRGVPAVEALNDIDQPVLINGRPVTYWRLLPEHRQGRPGEIGSLLKRLHSQRVPEEIGLAPLNPFVRLPERISAASTLSPDDRAFLADHLEALRAAWGHLPEDEPCVVHGDAWAGNVVVALGETSAFFVDLERFSIGSPAWDLVSTAIKLTSFAWISPEDYAEFCKAYGQDVTAWDGFEVMRDVRELRMTCYLAQHASEHPDARSEAQLRVDCLRDKSGARPWRWSPLS
ncbi:Phosphotransferase enzyme family protein [Sinosporangium album]|uniref:Phosphotransferase enzyme family protein n=1 Tax=Sinosporangium album TaxID=504805 RepID=A0A1G7U1A6_9ACTN|nr:aminoglycoside phosphotransferase family protein [Sinosporangium album]SDG41395.1 Phosphotransferase enzyme family protein [Sinosporangium album]